MWHCTARKKKKERKGPGEGCLAGISLVYILIKNRLRGIVRKLRLIHSRQVFSNTACRVLINFFIGVPFYTFTREKGGGVRSDRKRMYHLVTFDGERRNLTVDREILCLINNVMVFFTVGNFDFIKKKNSTE